MRLAGSCVYVTGGSHQEYSTNGCSDERKPQEEATIEDEIICTNERKMSEMMQARVAAASAAA